MSQILWETTQKSRGEYFCDYCCQWILPGETYRRWLWKPGGRTFIVMRRHQNPSCDFEDVAEQYEDAALAIPITYQIVQKRVELVLRDGRNVTEYHPEYVAVVAAPALIAICDEEVLF